MVIHGQRRVLFHPSTSEIQQINHGVRQAMLLSSGKGTSNHKEEPSHIYSA